MRTVTYGGAVSLDGYLAAADGAIDWLHFSPDVQQVMTAYWKDVDTILMGRKTWLVAAAQAPAPRRTAPREAGEGARDQDLRVLTDARRPGSAGRGAGARRRRRVRRRSQGAPGQADLPDGGR